jgi:hypothetical protein
VHRALAGKECENRAGFNLICSDLQNLGACDNKEYTCTVSAQRTCSCTSR